MLRVLAWPGPTDPAVNPYIRLLYAAVCRADADIEIHDWPPTLREFLRADVWHIHWPDRAARGRTLVHSIAKAAIFGALVTLARSRGTRVVWTVHNIRGHDRPYPRVESIVLAWFSRRLDGWIVLSESSRRLALEGLPALASTPMLASQHGHYIDVYNYVPNRTTARSKLGFDNDAWVIGLVGQLFPYKNAAALMRSFKPYARNDERLLIAGPPSTIQLAEEIRDLASGDWRITIRLEKLSDEELLDCVAACDALVLPFYDVLNSGTAILALSCGRPIVLPNAGVAVDLMRDVGTRWIRLFNQPLTPEQLRSALDALQHQDRDRVWLERRLRSQWGWDEVGKQTALFFRTISTGIEQSDATLLTSDSTRGLTNPQR